MMLRISSPLPLPFLSIISWHGIIVRSPERKSVPSSMTGSRELCHLRRWVGFLDLASSRSWPCPSFPPSEAPQQYGACAGRGREQADCRSAGLVVLERGGLKFQYGTTMYESGACERRFRARMPWTREEKRAIGCCLSLSGALSVDHLRHNGAKFPSMAGVGWVLFISEECNTDQCFA